MLYHGLQSYKNINTLNTNKADKTTVEALSKEILTIKEKTVTVNTNEAGAFPFENLGVPVDKFFKATVKDVNDNMTVMFYTWGNGHTAAVRNPLNNNPWGNKTVSLIMYYFE